MGKKARLKHKKHNKNRWQYVQFRQSTNCGRNCSREFIHAKTPAQNWIKNMFFTYYSNSRLTSLSIDAGTVPDSWLYDKVNECIAGKSNGGMVPDKLLPSSLNVANDVKDTIEAGIVPERPQWIIALVTIIKKKKTKIVTNDIFLTHHQRYLAKCRSK